jgi:RNA polymerase sigma-70 factor (ECF subfamily)
LEKLPPEQREVVSYRLAGELTFAQIGQALEISTQTAASRYRYALEKLRLLLKEVC